MSFYLSGGVEVLGFISPTEITDEYPVIDPLYGIDGLRNVDLLSDLNNIPTPRRRPGMIVGVSGGTQYYKLNSPPWNNTISDWSIFNSGGGAFTGGTVTGPTIFTNGLSATTISATTIGTSGDCVDDIYVSNIHSCSPLNINPLDEGNVYFGSTSGVTFDLINNKVGIGTSTPNTIFHVVGNYTGGTDALIPQMLFQNSNTIPNTNKTAIIRTTVGTGYVVGGYPEIWLESQETSTGVGLTKLRTVSNHPLLFYTNDLERVRLTETGNFGINTPSPAGKLHIRTGVNKNIIFTSGATGNQIRSLVDGNAAYTGLDLDSLNLNLKTNGLDRVVVDSSGNVGIGTITPTAKLHINNTTSGNTFLAEDSTNPDSSPFIIDASGNTGIGTLTPTAKLQVKVNDFDPVNFGFAVSDSGNTSNYFTVNNVGQVGIRTPYTGSNNQFLIRNTNFAAAEVRFNTSDDYAFTILDNQGYGFSSSPSSISINTRSVSGNINIWTQAGNTTRLNLGGQDINPTVARTRTIISPVNSNTVAFTPSAGTAIDYSFETSGTAVFQPTGGTASYTQIQLRPSYNTTGSYSGTVRGLYYNPILTSLVGATHRAIETTTGDVIFGSTSGNVGIGTATPTTKLDVRGSSVLGTTTGDTTTFGNGIIFNYNVNPRIFAGDTIIYQSNNTSRQHYFVNDISSGLGGTIVEIGNGSGTLSTTTNNNFLNISGRLVSTSGANDSNAILISSQVGNGGTYSGVTRGLYYNPSIIGSGFTHRAIETTTGDVIFGSTSGNVGIGTTTPSEKLQVSGNISVSGSVIPNTQIISSSATVTPTYGNDLVAITGLSTNVTINNPTGTWPEGKDLTIRIKDNGVARTIAWDTKYRAIGVTLPNVTIANKTTYVGLIYNSIDDKFDVIGSTTEL